MLMEEVVAGPDEGLAVEARALVADLRPVPVKESANLGVVELVLAPGTTVKVVGVVYGLEQMIEGEGYKAQLLLDQYSQRVKILSYEAPGDGLGVLVERVQWLMEANGFDKIIVMAPRVDWQRFLRYGFVMEAVLSHYLRGEDAFVMCKFGSQQRLTSGCLFEEVQLIEAVMRNVKPHVPATLPEGHTLRLAERRDIPALIELYQHIFETYPSPLIYDDYLRTVFARDSLFAVVEVEGRGIVAAASAELYPEHLAAELTDCATLPECRGKGLMSLILGVLERELERRDYICAYSMARGRSFGMNRVFHQLGYAFQGRLINNCDIYGTYEDMHIWVKRL
jgi:beta-lysine N6-acetyltransferase